MIDFWEALGRLAYDKDLFREFQEVLPNPQKRLPSENLTVNTVTATVLNFSEDAYSQVKRFLRPILTEQYVSLFVAGELIWTFSQQKTRDAFAGLHDLVTEDKLPSPSTSYFIGLGLILVDELFRAEVVKNPVQLLPRLSQPQREQLRKLAQNPEFLKKVALFDDPWDEGCFEWLLPRAGYVHPVALDATKQTADATAVTY